MRNKLIAIAAIVMAPALAYAQGGGGGGGGGGHGGGTAAGTGGQGGQSGAATSGGASTGGQSNNGGVTANSGAANPPTTAEERHHDSLVVKMRQQQGQTGASVEQQATAGTAAPGADTGSKARQDTTSNKASAQSDTTMRRDTTNANASAQTDTSGLVKSSAAGGLATTRRGRSRNMGLSTDQVKQLQQAINQNGCKAGPADGQFGPETRQGVQCIRQQKNITEKGLNPVLQALNLGFTASPSASSDSTSMGGHRRMHPDTTGTAQQQYPSPKKAQHGKGMHDSTTSSDTTRSKSDTSHKQ
jgi:hypothetical protein